MAIDFGDLASRYLDARIDRATQPFTDPEAYLNNRLQQNFGVDMNGNTKPVSTTISYGDNGQPETVTTKHEVGETPQVAPQATMSNLNFAPPQVGGLGLQMPQQAPAGQPMFNVGAPQEVTAQPATPQQIQQEAQLPRQMAQVAEVAKTASQLEPQPQVQEQPQVQLPQPGPGVQLAGPMVQGAVPNAPSTTAQPNQAPAAAPAPTPSPTWQTELEAAQRDPNKLWAFTQNPAHPEDARKFAAGLYANSMETQKKADEATKMFTNAFANGDIKAQNQIMRDLRKENEEGSLIKAVLYSRLGLSDMAKQEQAKLGAGNKVSRAMLDGQSYATDTDSKGFIKRAWDATGAPVDDKTLSRLNAESTPFGTHAFGFTGGLHTISTGEILQPRTNTITGQAEYTYVTGPNKGKVYTGTEQPQQQRVATSAQVALNNALIKFQSSPSTAFANKLMELAASADPGDGSEIRRAQETISKTPFAQGQTVPGAAPAVTAPAAAPAAPQVQAPVGPVNPQAVAAQPAAAPQVAQPTAQVTPAAAAVTTPGVAATAGRRPGESFDQYQQRLKLGTAAGEANIQERKEVSVAEKKPAAEAKGKNEARDVNNQHYANETYGLIRPISDAIKQSTGSGLGTKADQLAGVFGVGTTGAQAKAQLDVLGYNLVSNVPRFEGAQSDRDVALYERAAGDIANSEKPVSVRLAALNTIIQMLKKYDKAGKNDWSFTSEQPGGGGGAIKIISREKVQ